MSVRRLAPPELQPKDFAFTPANVEWAKKQIAKYPEGRQASAIIPLLWRAQEQHHGWLPEVAIRYVADMVGMVHIRAMEVATFYTQFQLQPVGSKAHVQVCGTTPCQLRGAGAQEAHSSRAVSSIRRRQAVVGRGRVSWRLRERADGLDLERHLRRSQP
jgi:NADH-quinone oxidoreductase subunit E